MLENEKKEERVYLLIEEFVKSNMLKKVKNFKSFLYMKISMFQRLQAVTPFFIDDKNGGNRVDGNRLWPPLTTFDPFPS